MKRFRTRTSHEEAAPITRLVPVPTALIAYLEENWPVRCAKVGESELNHHRYAGRVDLIAHLRQLHDAQLPVDPSAEGTIETASGHVLTFEQAHGEMD